MSKVDITERLNNLVHISRTIDEEWIEWAHADMMEAKEEIERLRQELAEAESCLWTPQDSGADIGAAAGEDEPGVLVVKHD